MFIVDKVLCMKKLYLKMIFFKRKWVYYKKVYVKFSEIKKFVYVLEIKWENYYLVYFKFINFNIFENLWFFRGIIKIVIVYEIDGVLI